MYWELSSVHQSAGEGEVQLIHWMGAWPGWPAWIRQCLNVVKVAREVVGLYLSRQRQVASQLYATRCFLQ